MKPRKQLSLRVIAATLRERAKDFPDCNDPRHNTDEPAVFRFGTFVVRCRPTRQAVLAVAAKFEKKSHAHFRTRIPDREPSPGLKRPPDADERLARLIAECGEPANDDAAELVRAT